MRYEELETLLRRWKITIVPKEQKRIRGHDVDTYRRLAKQTEQIDYDCIFLNGGGCNGRSRGPNGCCTPARCAETLGYWRREGGTLDDDTARRLAGPYDPDTGFLRDGTGCALPRELRSPTCLFIYCSDAKMTDDDKILLAQIQYGAYMLR
ncbi:MAG: hypothetical protein A4E28_00670 [Methanocella sp. PtaU1.Bin125]|nr:MAG: hypothetical protein A4E28_00670 [Methanocella sp. PtaU1.Bin125]